MAYYADEEQFQELQEVPLEHQLEERLVEELEHHVQDSVNWALIKALKPFTQSLTNFGRKELVGEGSQQTRSQTYEFFEVSGLPMQLTVGSSSAEMLAQIAASVLRDHEYGGFDKSTRSYFGRRPDFITSSTTAGEVSRQRYLCLNVSAAITSARGARKLSASGHKGELLARDSGRPRTLPSTKVMARPKVMAPFYGNR
ncbi:hypothetical protein NDU88_001187 [Pleurodeles waltl]|uniref:Uncharacterized protein n=1 Tax=Pleurodeles waltl TaxID=8319 RepID=A0AAV7R8A9_PLEWA|nr:hypothetical protein NDU88_001187 [Pleurodeles waltl]